MKNQHGISLIEALVAAVIIGIGFAAVYGLATTSTNMLMSSIDREKGNMIAGTIFEDLITDVPNLLSYHNMDFRTIGSGNSAHMVKKTKWAGIAFKRFGTPQSNDKRKINVVKRTIDGKDVFIVTINLATRGGKSKNQFKKVFNAP
jgi:hypothetical protein|tara:strand:- start:1071 stop:1508 length:438 start_codon:yes stop_codon:yes gene_type:complete